MAIKSPCFFLSYFTAVSVASRVCSRCSDRTPACLNSPVAAAPGTVLGGHAATDTWDPGAYRSLHSHGRLIWLQLSVTQSINILIPYSRRYMQNELQYSSSLEHTDLDRLVWKNTEEASCSCSSDSIFLVKVLTLHAFLLPYINIHSSLGLDF